ncbi:anthranilate synthase component I family protein [Mycobacterium xenopi 4042]|uniref:Anthranilate synthase component I family protein n=1 Tax=Mycobacterium xenopi 4042 TaxID=1299334 RepID=X7YQS8_MYCXE|nr:anthranilate synthase component I family protein [Mycobacterium xenopi 4042]
MRCRRTRRPAATRCRRCAPPWSCWPPPAAGLPPLSGGMVGFFAYDLVRRLERLPELAVDDLHLPDMLLLLATDLAAVDHHEGTITLIANAVNWNGTDERVDEAYDDAIARLDVMTAALGQPLPSTVATFTWPEPNTVPSAPSRNTARLSNISSGRSRPAKPFRWCLRSASKWTPTSNPSTCTGSCGPPTPVRICICFMCRMTLAERIFRLSDLVRKHW